MTFFSDDRASELRELFFETATELLQTLNEEGLELEKRPEDEEVLRRVRRTVHTLKGDSAACGYTELSDLSHALEDVLKPEVAVLSQQALAEVVLIAADTFSSMLSAYHGNMQPPAGEELKQQILSLTRKPASNVRYKLQARFVWSEYEQIVVADALSHGESVYNVAFSIEPQCPMRGAAMQLIRNVLQGCGRLLAIAPDQSTLSNDLDVVEAAIASEHAEEWIAKKCRIPSVVADVLIQKAGRQQEQTDDVLDIVKHVTAPVDDETEVAIHAEEMPRPSVMAPAEPEVSAAASAQAAALADTPPASFASMSETLLRVDAEKIDSVLNLVGELIIAKSMLHQAINEFDKRYPKDPLKMRFSDAMAF
ncbi:MAG TPA: Hpt domain-containing protein, partial [Candidatus Angelobacter sp.]|nr:Hpt domain-containing protein [Candidatus Angelobacter sp.]